MIELLPPAPDAVARLLLRPNRALSEAQLGLCLVAMAVAVALVAALSFTSGNVFAPLYALLVVAAMALGLARCWRQGERCEVIAVGPRSVVVRRLPELDESFRADTCWVRLEVERITPMPRVWLGSRGRRVEVGAFLGAGEREALARRLRALLDLPGEGTRPVPGAMPGAG
jgi:uncharacterized membrane protein